MRTIRLSILMLALGMASSGAIAQSRPLVEVTFNLAEPVFRASFRTNIDQATGASELQLFQTNVARAMEIVLASRVGFLRFGLGTNAYTLRITLNPHVVGDPSTRLVPTHFSFELSVPTRPPARLDWEFRSAQEYINPVVPDTFLREVTNRLAVRLDADLPAAITSLFSHIPLAGEIYLLVNQTTTFCVLPFSYEEIEAGQNTGFEIASSRQDVVIVEQHHGARGIAAPTSGLTNLPSLYVRGIPAQEDARLVRVDHNRRPFPHTRFVELGATNGPIRGLGLYVTDYVRVPSSSIEVHTPSDFRLP